LKDCIVIPDIHAKPGVNNRRAEWLGKLIADVKPDIVVMMGDAADLSSISVHDKGTIRSVGKYYKRDIDAHLDFQDRLWSTVRKQKRKMPRRIALHGNHEYRIERLLSVQPELDGIISYKDLCLEDYYNEIVPYEGSTPGSITIDGVVFAHYLVSGVSGRAIGGEHSAHSLLAKQHTSSVVGHSHILDYSVKTRSDGRKIAGLVSGCFFEDNPWYAGGTSKLFWRGVCHLKNLKDGFYDLRTYSLSSIKHEYL
jgi:hypothetical protein